jgi:hypothetical protein
MKHVIEAYANMTADGRQDEAFMSPVPISFGHDPDVHGIK